MFDGLFTSQQTKPKTGRMFEGIFDTQVKTQSQSIEVSSQQFFTLLPDNMKPKPATSLNQVFNLKTPGLGGGQYVTGKDPNARDISAYTKDEIRGGSFQQTLSEVNHIISVGAGGTNAKENLNALQSDLTFKGKLKRLFGAPVEIADLKNRQQGRIKIETEVAKDIKSGKITQAEGIVRLKGWDFLQESLNVIGEINTKYCIHQAT